MAEVSDDEDIKINFDIVHNTAQESEDEDKEDQSLQRQEKRTRRELHEEEVLANPPMASQAKLAIIATSKGKEKVAESSRRR